MGEFNITIILQSLLHHSYKYQVFFIIIYKNIHNFCTSENWEKKKIALKVGKKVENCKSS